MASPGRHCGGAPSWAVGCPSRLVTATAQRAAARRRLIAAVYLYVSVVDSLSIYVAEGWASSAGEVRSMSLRQTPARNSGL